MCLIVFSCIKHAGKIREIIINKQCRRELYETISIGFFMRVFIPACHEVVGCFNYFV